MNIDRERFSMGSLPIWVYHEHLARWQFSVNYINDKIVADCACGVGEGTYIFGSSGASFVYAFDLSNDAVESTLKRCSGLSNISILKASGLSLPLPDNSIDIFISFETIEHIDDDRTFLSEVSRVLRTDGIFICSTPNRTITMPGKELIDKPWNPFHVREYNQKEFKSLLETRFKDINIFGQNILPLWRVKALSLLGKILPGNMGGRINSALKIPRFIYDKLEHHMVTNVPVPETCEYIVAICKKPY